MGSPAVDVPAYVGAFTSFTQSAVANVVAFADLVS